VSFTYEHIQSRVDMVMILSTKILASVLQFMSRLFTYLLWN